MKFLAALLLIGFIWSCSGTGRFSRDEAAFNASAITRSFISVADMNDSYFDIRENNFFEFYKMLFDSVKNTRYPGKYSLKGDTMILHFYDKKGPHFLGSKALVASGKNQIIFFK